MKILKIIFLLSFFLVNNNLFTMEKKGFVSQEIFNNIQTVGDVLRHSKNAIIKTIEKKSAEKKLLNERFPEKISSDTNSPEKKSEISYIFKCHNALHTHTNIKSFTIVGDTIINVKHTCKMRASTGFICEMVLATSILGIIASLDESIRPFISGLFN